MSENETDLDLRSLTGALRRYAVRIVLAAAVVGLLAFALSTTTERPYAATAYVEIEDPAQDAISVGTRSNFDIEVQRRAVMVLIESPTVRQGVVERLGEGGTSGIDVSATGEADSALVGVRAVSTSAERAQEIANLTVQVANDVRRSRLTTDFQAIADQLKRDSDTLDDQIRDFEGRIKALDQSAAQSGIAAVVAPGAVPTATQIEAGLIAKQQADEAAVTRQQRATVFEQQLELDRQSKQYELEAAVRSPGFRPYRDADLPSGPSGPGPLESAVLAAAAALALAIGIAYVVAYGDGRLRRANAHEADRVGLALLATVPAVGGRSAALPVSDEAGADRVVAPARQSLALTLRYGLCGDGPVVLGVAAPRAGDRCANLVADLALTLARSGLDVLVVDADMRRAAGEPTDGLSAVLAGDRFLDEELKRLPRVRRGGNGSLSLLPAGGLAVDPVGLVGSAALDELLSDFLDLAECVIVDLPPVLESPEALTLARTMSAVVLTAVVGTTRRNDIRLAAESLGTVGARVQGIVMADHGRGGGRRDAPVAEPASPRVIEPAPSSRFRRRRGGDASASAEATAVSHETRDRATEVEHASSDAPLGSPSPWTRLPKEQTPEQRNGSVPSSTSPKGEARS